MKKELYVTCKDMVNIQLIRVFKEALEQLKENFAAGLEATKYVYLNSNLKVTVTGTLEDREDSLLIAVINKEDIKNAWSKEWEDRTLCRDNIIDQMQERILDFINAYKEGEGND